MKKNSFLLMTLTVLCSTTLWAATTAATTAATKTSTIEESIASRVIGKVLASIDYSQTTFNLNLFEGAFSSDEKNKSSFDIQKLDAQLNLKFKDNIVIHTDEFIKNLPQISQTKQWIPYITLNFKDYRLRANVTTANQNSKTDNLINVQINFKKTSASSVESLEALKIQVGNDLNKNLVNMNLIALNVNIGTSIHTPEMIINGSCRIDKIAGTIKQPIEVCSFKGQINPTTGKYNIKVNFSDKKNDSQSQLLK